MASAPLRDRPKAELFAIEDLAALLHAGEIRVPHFQRPQRWRAKHILDLFDSIVQGYPVGSLLFWRRPAPEPATFTAGSLHIPLPPRSSALYVVDGQQRLTSLAGVLLHPAADPSPQDIFALWYDPDDGKIRRPERGESPGSTWVPLNVILDAVRLGEWREDHPELTREQFRSALEVARRVRETKIPAYIVESDEPDTLKIIFTRLNNAGVEMRLTEVFNALHADEDKAKNPLERLQCTIREAGMGRLEERWLVRTLRVVAGDALDTDMNANVGAYSEVVEPTQVALGLALDFLRVDLTVPHLQLLPGGLPLVVLVQLFHRHPVLHPRNRMLLRRWFWRGFVNRRHIDTGKPHFREFHRLFKTNSGADAAIQALLADVGRVREEQARSLAREATEAEHKFNSVEVKLLGMFLASLEPRDAETGEAIAIGALIDQAGAAALQLTERGRVLHPSRDDLDELLNAADPEIQASHVWTPDRADQLQQRMREGLMAWCEADLPDNPPLPDDDE